MTLNEALQMLLQVCVAFVATVAFAVLFHVPKQQYVFSGTTGAVGWLFYLIAMWLHPSVVLASFAATVMLTALSRIFAVYRKAPITLFLVCGIFPLVPGAGIYYTAYYLIMSQNELALAKGLETIKIAVAIALGIVLIISLPYNLFRPFRSRKPG